MLRIATEADVPAMLDIYAPYILNTTYSFEYTVPDEKAFLARFREITSQFPWLVWAMPMAPPPSVSGPPMPGARKAPSTCAPMPRAGELDGGSTPGWRLCCPARAISGSTPSSPRKTPVPWPSIPGWALSPGRSLSAAAISLTAGSGSTGMKKC